MKTKEKTFLRFLSSSDSYDPDKLEYDKQLITQFYNNNGYPNFKFTSSIAQLKSNTNNFEIILNVNEGSKYNFGNIIIESLLKKLNVEALENILPVKEGNLFNRSLIRKSIDELKELAQLEGYTFIDISTEYKENEELNTILHLYLFNLI